MAEAHAAVAFQFTVTHEGIDVNVNHEALRAVYESSKRSWKKRWARFRNHLVTTTYPASPASWLAVVTAITASLLAKMDPSCGIIGRIGHHLPQGYFDAPADTYVAAIIFSTLLWLSIIFVLRLTLKNILYYHAWIYEPRGKMSIKSKLQTGMLALLCSKTPMLYSYQSALPNLPLPKLKDTMKRYLRSVRGLMDDGQYKRMEGLVSEFQNGIGVKLQRYLYLKWLTSSNYVSDWWEEYVYLRGRSPIMVNSNFYGVDAIFSKPTHIQAARAGNVVYTMLRFRQMLDRQQIKPLTLNKFVPLCSWQYERTFNTTRIPGLETDKLVHHKTSKHIVVYHQGRYFKVQIQHQDSNQLLKPCELEKQFQKIIDDESAPLNGEEKIAALTAGDRIPWAQTRERFFRNGVNKISLDAVEKAALFLTLDDDEPCYDPEDCSKLDQFATSLLAGNGHNRWFDKSITLVIFKNGKMGFNAEHSWADAPISAHMWEYCMAEDLLNLGYRDNGHCKGESEKKLVTPQRLKWEIEEECQKVIESSLATAKKLADNVDLHLVVHNAFGKGLMKQCKVSPDAYIQMGMQLAYFRDAGKFNLTYEASMTRVYREGRTETVRPCTVESCEFVHAMDDPEKTDAERRELMRKACEVHVKGYRDSMTGKGIDRHLFCLYVVSKYLEVESPFLQEVLSEPWRLSTSQTPYQQTDKWDLKKHTDYITAGGGFGPVAADGYGVSYIIAGEDHIFFHVSCTLSSPETDSKRFGAHITRALSDIRKVFDK
ncbi:carnitine O-palmitoyltransferase 1, liver isoform-like [Ptychodera flava]|uniref:carnitine O-palmitoyltransferase 1, liver isoform-like n=1 Tax=Ptychodera flava TaxID=63121 RepID=UPI003969E2CE